AASVAYQLGSGFVPVRKQGRLPGPTYARSYQLEYGTATIEVHQDAFTPGERVLIVDDVLATGGTAEATTDLVRRAGAEVAGIALILALSFLGGRNRLPPGILRSLLVVCPPLRAARSLPLERRGICGELPVAAAPVPCRLTSAWGQDAADRMGSWRITGAQV